MIKETKFKKSVWLLIDILIFLHSLFLFSQTLVLEIKSPIIIFMFFYLLIILLVLSITKNRGKFNQAALLVPWIISIAVDTYAFFLERMGGVMVYAVFYLKIFNLSVFMFALFMGASLIRFKISEFFQKNENREKSTI